MSITISSNQAASYTALHMKRANSLLTKSLQRLSSGKRIVSPADDAGGLAGHEIAKQPKESCITHEHAERNIVPANARQRDESSRRNLRSHGRA